MSNPNGALLRRLHNALPEQTARDVEIDSIYVRRSADYQPDTIAKLRQLLTWSERPNQTFLFSGLRGSGKTTELLKLIKVLREDEIAAYYCDISLYLNLRDTKLELSDVLVAAMAGFSVAAEEELGQTPIADRGRAFWEFLNQKVNLEFRIEAHGFSASLADQPRFLQELRRVSQQSNALYHAIADFGNDLARRLCTNRQAKKVVLVVDSLERLSAPPGAEQDLFECLKKIFFYEPNRLRFEAFSVIYSAPPYLHPVLPSVSNGFSHHLALPNFKVMQRPELDKGFAEPEPNPSGLLRLREVLERRMPDWREVAEEAVIDRLAWMSGGNVSRFFALIRMFARALGLSGATLPIHDPLHPAVEQTLSEAAQPLQWLNAEDRRWLATFKADPEPARQIKSLHSDLPPIMRLFEHSLVLDYQNGEVWYQVPPLVRERVHTS